MEKNINNQHMDKKKTKLAKRGEPKLKSSQKSWICTLRKLKETKNWTKKMKKVMHVKQLLNSKLWSLEQFLKNEFDKPKSIEWAKVLVRQKKNFFFAQKIIPFSLSAFFSTLFHV